MECDLICEILLHAVEELCGLVQHGDLNVSQWLLHNVGDSLGSKHTRQRQEHFLIDAVLALETKPIRTSNLCCSEGIKNLFSLN